MTHHLRDLSNFSKEEVDTFLASFDTVLTDCDGVLWHSKIPLEGSIEVVNRLKKLGKKVFLVSNNSLLSPEDYVKKTKTFGLNVTVDEVIIPSVVAASYLKELNLKKKVYILASPALKEIFKSNGIIFSSDVGLDYVETLADMEKKVMELDKDVGAVFIDFDMNINYINMMKAVLHLMDPECLFVVGAADKKIPIRDGVNVIGPGHFISAIESLSGRKAVVMGKPSPLIKEFIAKNHSIDPDRTIMIGDTIPMDMQLGANCGFQKLLVLSGIAKLEDTKEDSLSLPNYFIKKLGDLLPLLPSV